VRLILDGTVVRVRSPPRDGPQIVLQVGVARSPPLQIAWTSDRVMIPFRRRLAATTSLFGFSRSDRWCQAKDTIC
jgi:hypothetical protein